VFEVDGVPIVNGAFCQSSLTLNRMLLRVVSEMVGNPESLLDLYCGNGNLSLWLARQGARVEGYDHAPETVHAANALGLGGYHRGGETVMAEVAARGGFETVILDPPRSGAAALMPVLEKSDAERIVYVSCDPATLARDLTVLAAGGWRPVRAAALDLFPHTPHVETVCLLRRDGPKETES
jgi:23S rRNA (uracil1939-C5)-methyltransferase